MSYRVAFNPELPVVAASPFKAAGRDLAAGDAVDWRAMGVTVEMLRDWWLAGIIVHPLDAPGDAQAPVSANEQTTCPPTLYDATCSIDTSKLTRAERRALRKQG